LKEEKMDHSYFKDRISAFKDGGLPPYEQAAIEEHLNECEDCRMALVKLEQLDKLAEDHSQLDGKEYWEQLAQKIEHGIGIDDTNVTDVRPAKGGYGLRWKWLAAAASVAILTFIGLHQTDIFREKGVGSFAPSLPVITDTVGSRTSEAEVPSGSEGEVVERLESPSLSESIEQDFEQSSSGMDNKAEAPLPVGVSRSATPPIKRETVTGPGRQDAGVGLKQEAESLAPALALPDRGELRRGKEVIVQKTSPPGSSEEKLGITKSYLTDENYKKQAQTANIRPTGLGTKTIDIQTPETPTVSETKPLSHFTLDDWRRRKDSLSRLLLSSGKTRRTIDLSVESKSGETLATDTSQSQEQLESQLLKACYHVANLSSDSAEVKRATEILQGVAADSASSLRGTASAYLWQLKRE
jgi:hypothetical protein